MYEYIRGEVAELTPAFAVIEAAGVGYNLSISLQTYTALSGLTTAKLYTHYVVREDAQLLFGFFAPHERDIFRLLIGVSGVGGNTARMILSTFKSEEVCTIIATGGADQLKTVKGLGLKTSQKIIVELRDKVGAIGSYDPAGVIVPQDNANLSEAMSALVMLGFARPASEKVLNALLKENPMLSVEELVRASLKKL